LVSSHVIVFAAVLTVVVALAMRSGATQVAAVPFQVLAGMVAIRAGIAALQWASRLYVLTNRRVMCFQGVFSVRSAECPLARISAADVHAHWVARIVRTGTIRMQPVDAAAPAVTWDDVARPEEIHELLVRAIRKAQSKD
jgi:uncharacterized membrane protein YdbT with pleckstrin-like domain